MPVGYQTPTTGDVQPAINAMLSSRTPHAFLGIDADGRTAIVNTTGNRWGHVILRGGDKAPNYDPVTVADSIARLQKAKLPPCVMVDCSHANSYKKYDQQENVWRSVIQQRTAGNAALFGLMLESNLSPGRQDIPAELSQLKYGISVTDECIGWDKTAELLAEAYAALA
jgi:3-deoxy-7-phosphoheptulonate synthase